MRQVAQEISKPPLQLRVLSNRLLRDRYDTLHISYRRVTKRCVGSRRLPANEICSRKYLAINQQFSVRCRYYWNNPSINAFARETCLFHYFTFCLLILMILKSCKMEQRKFC